MALFHFRPRLFHKTANWKTTICVIEGSAPPHPETTIFIITKIKRRKDESKSCFSSVALRKGGFYVERRRKPWLKRDVNFSRQQTAQKRSERMAQLISRFSRPVQYLHPVETPVDPRPRRPPRAVMAPSREPLTCRSTHVSDVRGPTFTCSR